MAEEKKKNDFGKGLLVGGLVGLGVGVAGTCVAAALMTDDDEPDEIENQVEEKTEESEAESDDLGFISRVVNATEKAGGTVQEEETPETTDVVGEETEE